jgi:hypothetical protein
VRLVSSIVALILLIATPALAQDASAQPQVDEAHMTAAQAEQRVREIVNQPIKHLPRTDEAAQFSPGWFHPGAITPDFAHVDIRQSQELPYAKFDYVTSDLNPSEMFYGHSLEFNAMTKYFYTDRTLPKRRLSEDEMLEINRLYRIIGHEQHASTMHMLGLGVLALGFFLVVMLVLLARRL